MGNDGREKGMTKKEEGGTRPNIRKNSEEVLTLFSEKYYAYTNELVEACVHGKIRETCLFLS